MAKWFTFTRETARVPQKHLLPVRVTNKAGESAWVQPVYRAKVKRPKLVIDVHKNIALIHIPLNSEKWGLDEVTKKLQRNPEWVINTIKLKLIGVPFTPGYTIPVFGQEWKLEGIEQDVPFHAEKVIYAPFVRFESNVRAYLNDLLEQYVTEQVLYYAEMLGVRHGPVYITPLNQAWGIHTFPGHSLGFDENLIGAPKQTIDAIALHEVAHIIERSHNQQFWKIVYSCMPKAVYDHNMNALSLETDLGIRIRRLGRKSPVDVNQVIRYNKDIDSAQSRAAENKDLNNDSA